jgi:hypothetical protein
MVFLRSTKEYLFIQIRRSILILIMPLMIGFLLPFISRFHDDWHRTQYSNHILIIKDDPIKTGKFAIPKPKKIEGLYHPIILAASDEHQVDAALIKAIIMVESNFNPFAVSKKGAMGLMQIMPDTAGDMGVGDLFDPTHNINGGVKYLKKLLLQFNGDMPLAIAAYNAGSKTVQNYGGIPPFRDTQSFVNKVFEYYQYYKGETKEHEIL